MKSDDTGGLLPPLPPANPEGLKTVTALLARFNGGADQQLGPLYDLVKVRLEILASQLLESHPAVKKAKGVDDIVQDLWLRLLPSLLACKPSDGRQFFRLAARAMRWLLADMVRRLGRAPRPLDADSGAHETMPRIFRERHLPSGAAPGPQTTCDRFETLWRLHQALGALPASEKELMNNSYYLGLSGPEIAKVMSLSEKKVDYQLHRARKHLLALMLQMEPVK